MRKILDYYLIINYSGQKIGNPWNVEKGLLNAILSHISFLTCGFFIGLYTLIGLRSLPLVLVLLLALVLFIWKFFEKRIKENIDFVFLENSYKNIKPLTRIVYFIISMILIFLFILSMFYLIKLILMLK